MTTKLETFSKAQLKEALPEIRPGDTVQVFQKIKEKDKERTQMFEGQVLARKHGKGITSTITVRRVISGIGVERIFPLHSPNIEKIEVVKKAKVRRAKLYYLRTAKGRKAKLKTTRVLEEIPQEPTSEQPAQDTAEETEPSQPESEEPKTEEKK